MDRGLWQATVRGITKGRTRLKDYTTTSQERIFCGLQGTIHLDSVMSPAL